MALRARDAVCFHLAGVDVARARERRKQRELRFAGQNRQLRRRAALVVHVVHLETESHPQRVTCELAGGARDRDVRLARVVPRVIDQILQLAARQFGICREHHAGRGKERDGREVADPDRMGASRRASHSPRGCRCFRRERRAVRRRMRGELSGKHAVRAGMARLSTINVWPSTSLIFGTRRTDLHIGRSRGRRRHEDADQTCVAHLRGCTPGGARQRCCVRLLSYPLPSFALGRWNRFQWNERVLPQTHLSDYRLFQSNQRRL